MCVRVCAALLFPVKISSYLGCCILCDTINLLRQNFIAGFNFCCVQLQIFRMKRCNGKKWEIRAMTKFDLWWDENGRNSWQNQILCTRFRTTEVFDDNSTKQTDWRTDRMYILRCVEPSYATHTHTHTVHVSERTHNNVVCVCIYVCDFTSKSSGN